MGYNSFPLKDTYQNDIGHFTSYPKDASHWDGLVQYERRPQCQPCLEDIQDLIALYGA